MAHEHGEGKKLNTTDKNRLNTLVDRNATGLLSDAEKEEKKLLEIKLRQIV